MIALRETPELPFGVPQPALWDPASGRCTFVEVTRFKALAVDFFLSCLILGAIFAPLLALVSLAHGALLAVGLVAIVVGIIGATFWTKRRFDLPFPPWGPRNGPVTPGKRRFPSPT